MRYGYVSDCGPGSLIINLTQAHFFAEHAPFISQIFIGQESGKQ